MPRLTSLFPGLLCALALSGAHAATYQFTGPTYGVGITNYVAPCPGGSCADYTAGMRTTGWFTYLGSLAPNLVNHNLHADPNLLSYGLSDGLVSIESSHPATRMGRFQVSTDAGGTITSYWLVLDQWVDGFAGPHAANDRMHKIELFSGGSSTNSHNWICGTVGPTVPAGTSDGCTALGGNSGRSEALHSNVGVIVGSGLPSLSISSVSASEGNAGMTNLTFTVTLDAAPSAPASVGWSTLTGTATGGVDYFGDAGVLNWAAGDGSSRTLTVQVIGDTTAEADETFRVRLSNPVNVGINDPHGTGTILNDDSAPPAAAHSVPTLSEWAMLLMAGLMGLWAVFRNRRGSGRSGF